MTAWLTGLSTRDLILLFSHVMGFITNNGDDIEYFELGVALDYYGKTSCSHELRQTDIGLSTIGYEIGDYYRIIFETSYVKNGSGPYPEVDLKILVVDKRGCKNSDMSLENASTEAGVKFKAGCRYRCDALGGVTLSSDQVSYIIRTLSKLKEECDRRDYCLE